MMIINIIYIVILVFGILQIILFFKLWGMTNDVRAMKNKLEESSKDNNEFDVPHWDMIIMDNWELMIGN